MKIRGNDSISIWWWRWRAAVAVCGCQSPASDKPKKLLSTLRLHLEVSRDGTKANEPVPIYREKPFMVNVEKMPFLTEANVAAASVVDVVGGFALRIQFDHAGTGPVGGMHRRRIAAGRLPSSASSARR